MAEPVQQTTELAVGQMWCPTKAKGRAPSRHVVEFITDLDGYPAVRYRAETGGGGSMRVDGFKNWIRKMHAVVS